MRWRDNQTGQKRDEEQVRRITRVELRQVDLEPKVVRTDAIQAFVRQETLLVTVFDDTGLAGTGYAYTIGTGGSSVLALLHDHLAPRLLGRDPIDVEAIWKDLFFHTHATAVGAITSLALAAIDTALWDWRARATEIATLATAGWRSARVRSTPPRAGWLHLEAAQLVEQTLAAKAAGFRGAKIKIGRPHVSEDVARLAAVRAAVGEGFELMTDANQGFTRDEARRRAALEPREPEPAAGKCSRTTPRFIAGEPLVGIGHQFETFAHCRTDRRKPGHILADVRPADLDLGTAKSGSFCRQRLFDQFARPQMQPTALGGVDAAPALERHQQLPEWQFQCACAPVPEVPCRWRQAPGW